MPEPTAKSKLPKPSKAEKPPKQKAWKPLSPAAVRERLATGVHFSSKPVNTNARAVGVRLGRDRRIERPLIGLVSTALDRRTVDYQDGAVAGAMLSQCASVVEGSVGSDYKDVPSEQIDLIQQHVDILDQHAEVGTATVDPRLRQVLFPVASASGYVALTPLHSSVLSAHLGKLIAAESEARTTANDSQKRWTTRLMVGGSKAQNVGRISLVGSMQQPLLFGAPQEHRRLRAAYALFYKGAQVRALVQRRTLAELAAWREAHRTAEGHIASTADLREEERRLVGRVGVDARDELQRLRAIVAPHVAELGGWASPHLDEFTQSLLDEDCRSRNWPRELAGRLLRLVENHKATRDTPPMAGYGELDDYLDMIAEALQ